MSLASLDLWSDDIRVDVTTPLVILRSQESLLSRKTQGILRAEVRSAEGGDLVQHQLDLVAPALGDYRERLLTATHSRSRVYPVKVRAVCFGPEPRFPSVFVEAIGALLQPPPDEREAATQGEFIGLIREVLRSSEVRATIQSLIAKSNEVRISPEPLSPEP